MKKLGILTAGIFKENPVFVLMLGLCPTLGVTSSAINGFSMGLAVIAVLACSNGLISLFKKFIPDEVRIPAFIMIIATLVTVVDMVMNACGVWYVLQNQKEILLIWIAQSNGRLELNRIDVSSLYPGRVSREIGRASCRERV